MKNKIVLNIKPNRIKHDLEEIVREFMNLPEEKKKVLCRVGNLPNLTGREVAVRPDEWDTEIAEPGTAGGK